jgi:hypothetical protein
MGVSLLTRRPPIPRPGEVIAAFALIGAAQSLATPFSEVTSIFRSQAAISKQSVDVNATLSLRDLVLGSYRRE